MFYFYVPVSSKEEVKRACFEAGAGKIGEYSNCCFELIGAGQFIAMKGSRPFIGKKSVLTKIKEAKVEMIAPKKYLKVILRNFLRAHPYEEPAYGFIKILNFKDISE